VKLVLDEHYSPAVAEQLRLRGYDVIPVAERIGAELAQLRRMPDEELQRWARGESRILVTENVRDFMAIHHAFLARGEPHAGILFTSPRKFPRRTGAVGVLVSALAAFMNRQEPGALVGDVAWLQ
jgi:hypothetical protein